MTGFGQHGELNMPAVAASLIAILGCLALNLRALKCRRMSFELKAAMGVSWVMLIVGLAFLLTRLGY